MARSFPAPDVLSRTMERMAFVQADPIRAPARAQDLILRHRAAGYRAGDLERLYPSLDIEEDVLYAYGFVSRRLWLLLHPRKSSRLGSLETKVLDAVRKAGKLHPSELERLLGRKKIVNAWGGYSKAATSALEDLHWRGLVRVCRREKGIRIYAPAKLHPGPLPPVKRMQGLLLSLAGILEPVPESYLRSAAARFGRRFGIGDPWRSAEELFRSGRLEKAEADGRTYCWPAGGKTPEKARPQARILAPFDPLVWDRRRFEHFWGWSYRFEAYTPPARRVRGYYAMPLLWGDRVIGWVNARASGGVLRAEAGFVSRRPDGREFRKGFEEEMSRFRTFLNPRGKRAGGAAGVTL